MLNTSVQNVVEVKVYTHNRSCMSGRVLSYCLNGDSLCVKSSFIKGFMIENIATTRLFNIITFKPIIEQI